MAAPIDYVQLQADGSTSYQRIDGFGVNINSRYWDSDNPAFMRAMKLLVRDLGATLFRVDIWGKSNWVDPRSELDASVLTEENFARIHQGEVFRKGWAMMRYLNSKGIQPYLTVSGDVPTWMLGDDGKTLAEHEQLAGVLASMVAWAKQQEGLDFTLFGPMNETDIGSPEGPTVMPREYVEVTRIVDRLLRERGIDDIRYVVAEQARYDCGYVQAFVDAPDLHDRIGALGMHSYADYPIATYAEVPELVSTSPLAGTGIWLSEYGDLDQSGEKEWHIAWVSTRRLLDVLEAGLNGALAWDAYDNYHDHNEHWTIYGLIRTGLHAYTPKKRYYAAKQVYRYVLPGFERIAVGPLEQRRFEWWPKGPESNGIRMLAFANPERTLVTLVGMNASTEDLYINVGLDGFADAVTNGSVGYYRTTETENCAKVADVSVRTRNHPHWAIDVPVPGRSIFTLTNVD